VANPNSPITKLRLAAAKLLQPNPKPGYVWCVRCSLCRKRTAVFEMELLNAHLQSHNPGDDIEIRGLRFP
jgi:hypothetical protein